MLRISKKSLHIHVHCVRLPYNATNIFRGTSITLCFYYHTLICLDEFDDFRFFLSNLGSHLSRSHPGKIPWGVLWLQVPVAERACKVWAPEHKPSRILQRHSHDLWCFHLSSLLDKLGICAWTDGYLVDFDPRTHVVGDLGEDKTWKDMRCAFWKILFEVRAWNCSEVTSCTVSRANRVEADEGRDASFPRNVWSIIGFYHWFSWVSFALSYANNYNCSNVTTVCGKDGMMKRYFRRGLIEILDFIKAQEFNCLRWPWRDTNRDDTFHSNLLAIYDLSEWGWVFCALPWSSFWIHFTPLPSCGPGAVSPPWLSLRWEWMVDVLKPFVGGLPMWYCTCFFLCFCFW